MFEANKLYRMRNGAIAFVTELLPGLDYPVRGRVAFTGEHYSWTEAGRWDLHGECPRDLMAGALQVDPSHLEKRVADLEVQVKELLRARDGSHVVR